MKVTKAQAQENRAHIIQTASKQFRELGFDGVGVADLMSAAGFTHGGFYKHFGSKADLMAQAAECGIEQSLQENEGLNLNMFVTQYLSREHRDARSTGCTMAALSGDAARQSVDIKAKFAQGIERSVNALLLLSASLDGTFKADQTAGREQMISIISQLVGALVLSRACPDDSSLADEVLEVSRKQLLK